jgi:hypothetical protein
MELNSYVSEQQIIATLNVSPPDPADYARLLRNFLAGSEKSESDRAPFISEWEVSAKSLYSTSSKRFIDNYLARALIVEPVGAKRWQLPKTVSREESDRLRKPLVSAYLREVLDEWLNTGVKTDGSEIPGDRSLAKTGRALMVIWEYLENAPPTVRITPESEKLSVDVASPIGYRGDVASFFASQRIEATRLFLGVVVSDWKCRLCKCRYPSCGRYFLLRKVRRSYRRGTFCMPRHASSAAAKSAIPESRRTATAELVEEAARMLCRKNVGPEWQQDSELKRDLAQRLSLVIARTAVAYHRHEVRQNWVTWNKAAIESKRLERIGSGLIPGQTIKTQFSGNGELCQGKAAEVYQRI